MKAYYLQFIQEVKSGHNKSIGLVECGAVVDKRRWTKLGCRLNAIGDETKNNATKRISKLSELYASGLGIL